MKKIINSSHAPAPVGPYNHSAAFNGILFVSGQIALNPSTGEMVQESIEAETHLVMKNIEAILKEAGIGFSDILKCSVFVTDIQNYGSINGVYAEYFNEDTAPARELVDVCALPKGANVEISVIASIPN
ncbi:MAG: RidA family protein [Saprospiraceae bacterium]|nr:RidA family protein [Saprospiraceae bacterium]